MSQTKFIFDSDSLIIAKGIHYSPSFCAAFWDWVITGHQNGSFFLIDKVADELKKGNERDFLREFVEHNEDGLVLHSKNDHSCLLKYAQVQQWAVSVWANGKRPSKVATALEVFANEKIADPWLVSYASAYGYTIVTNESSAPFSQTSVKLPDAANALGVKTARLHEVLQLHSGNNFFFKS